MGISRYKGRNGGKNPKNNWSPKSKKTNKFEAGEGKLKYDNCWRGGEWRKAKYWWLLTRGDRVRQKSNKISFKVQKMQCVTIPKIWTKPNPKLFPIPNFSDTESDTFSISKIYDTESDTFFNTKFFRYRIRNHQKKLKSFETEKFRNPNVTLC